MRFTVEVPMSRHFGQVLEWQMSDNSIMKVTVVGCDLMPPVFRGGMPRMRFRVLDTRGKKTTTRPSEITNGTVLIPT